MASASSPLRLPWQLRVAAFIAASVFALSLIVVYAAGIKFVRLLAKVSAEIAQSESSRPSEEPAPQDTDNSGIVSVSILPKKTKGD
jgi:hypothetical protein